MSVTQKRDKLYYKVQKFRLRTDKDNFKAAKIFLQKILQRNQSSYFAENLVRNFKKSKELWKILNSVILCSKEENASKISLNKGGTIQFELREKANIFKKLYLELTADLVKKLTMVSNKYHGSNTTLDYSADIFKNKKIKFQLLGVSEVLFIKYFESCQNRSLTLSLAYQVENPLYL